VSCCHRLVAGCCRCVLLAIPSCGLWHLCKLKQVAKGPQKLSKSKQTHLGPGPLPCQCQSCPPPQGITTISQSSNPQVSRECADAHLIADCCLTPQPQSPPNVPLNGNALWYQNEAVNWVREYLPIGNGYLGGESFHSISIPSSFTEMAPFGSHGIQWCDFQSIITQY